MEHCTKHGIEVERDTTCPYCLEEAIRRAWGKPDEARTIFQIMEPAAA